MTTDNQNAEAPKGHEILTPEFLREHGAQEGMKAFWPTYPEQGWLGSAYVIGTPVAESDLERFIWCAPLGTMAMVSTPLPEAVCDLYCNTFGFKQDEHQPLCKAHPRNARVKVLPGWLAELKDKPEGLEWSCAGIKTDWEPVLFWPFSENFNGGGSGPELFAYSLPRYVYDAIEEGKRHAKNIAHLDEMEAAMTPAPAEQVQSLPGAGPECFGGEDLPSAPITDERFLPKPLPTYRPLAPDEVPQAGDDAPPEPCQQCGGLTFSKSDDGRKFCVRCTAEVVARPAVQPAPVAGTPEKKWLVWSNQCDAYWRTRGAGYTADSALAGRFTEDEARECCNTRSKNYPGHQPEVMRLAPEFTEGTREYQCRAERDALRKALEATNHMLGNLIPDMRRHGFHETAISNLRTVIQRNVDALTTKGGAK